ncbi:MAG TPA: hypothetical protein VJT31_10890 [Rugosimonospora sp.]|nr:hypothetical protein [Rugosimonospora sp.]
MKKALPVIVLVLVALFISRNPAQAATMARHLGTDLNHMASGFGQFISGIVGK